MDMGTDMDMDMGMGMDMGMDMDMDMDMDMGVSDLCPVVSGVSDKRPAWCPKCPTKAQGESEGGGGRALRAQLASDSDPTVIRQ